MRATIPLAVPRDVEEPAEPERPLVLADEDAQSLHARRARLMRVRLAVVGGLAAILVLIWALTGPENPWLVWPLLGLGLVAALDTWCVLGGRPVRESDLSGVEGDRSHAIRQLRRRRRLRIDAGVLVLINLFLIGIWIAADGGYFWPVWPILGSSVALGLKALPWAELARERLVGDVPTP